MVSFLSRCSVDFELWSTRVMQDPVDHTKGLDFQPFHMEWFNMAEHNRRSCIVAARGHGKTSELGIAYPLWKSFFNQGKKFMIVSDTLNQARGILSDIRTTIEDNELLLQLKPTTSKDTWKKTEIVTSTQCTIFTKPYSDKIRGNHVDYILCVTPDTEIECEGTSKRIRNIEIGDKVKTHDLSYQSVTKIYKRKTSEYLFEIKAGQNILKLTRNHPLYVKRGTMAPKWIRADELNMKDKLCYPIRGKCKSVWMTKKGKKPIASSLRKLKSICQLRKGRRFIYYPIQSIRRVEYRGVVYNLEVEKNHSYIANGFTVHNCDEAGEYKDHDLLNAAVTPCIVKRKGHIVAIGTRKSSVDMLAMLKKKGVYKYAEYPAEDKDGNILWESAFPRKELDRLKKEIGILAYTREYLCVPTSAEASFFPMKIIEPCCRENLAFSKNIQGRAFFGIDFAYAQGPHADWTVVVVGDKIGDKVYIRNIERFRGLSIEEQENKIREMYSMYKPVKVMMDSSNIGSNFVQRLRGEMPAYPVKFDPKNRLENLINLRTTIDRGNIIIPRSSEDMNCMGKTNILVDELLHFVEDKTPTGAMTVKSLGRHDDVVMALVCLAKGTSEELGVLDYIAATKEASIYHFDTYRDEEGTLPKKFTINTWG